MVANTPLARRVQSKPHRGFTLIELLVVVGIIAVLVSILLPALGRAQQQARAVACTSNLRQIAMWGLMYANDNKGVVPAHGEGTTESYWDAAGSRLTWEGNTGWYIKAGAPYNLWASGARSGRAVFCQEAMASAPPLRPSPIYTTYAINQFGGGYRKFTLAGGVIGNMPEVPKLSKLKRRAYWFGEGRIFYNTAGSNSGFDFKAVLEFSFNSDSPQLPKNTWPWGWDSSSVSGGMALRGHPNRISNFAFPDGHVEAVTQSQFVKMSRTQVREFIGYPF